MEKSEWKVTSFYLKEQGIEYFKVYRLNDKYLADKPNNREYDKANFFCEKEAQNKADELNKGE